MKPCVLISRPVSQSAIEMLSSICDTLPRVAMNRPLQADFRLIAECTDALLLGTTEHVDDALLREFPRLRVVACTFRLPEHIDVAACTRRGIWVTNVATRWLGKEAEIEAARNILDVLSGDTPRGAMNEILRSAA